MELCFVIFETVIVIITLVIVIFLEKLYKEKEEFLENMLEIEKEYSGKLEEEIKYLERKIEDVREVKEKH